MKKIFLILFCYFCCLVTPTNAANTQNFSDIGDPDSVILFQVNDKIFYTRDARLLEKFIQEHRFDPCLGTVFSGNAYVMWNSLMESCLAARNRLISELKELGGKAGIMGVKGYSSVAYGLHWLMNIMNESQADAYIKCLITNEELTERIEALRNTYDAVSIDADIDSCISSIRIVDPGAQTCSIEPAITNTDDIENIKQLNRDYKNKSFTFYKTISGTTHNKVIIFNGQILVACNGNKADYIVKPVYSGMEGCQQKRYNTVLQTGPIPDGVYLIKPEERSLGKDQYAGETGWGKYRFPLTPARETATFGRGSVYLHGTSDPNKHRSAGCISLGLKIGEFVDTGWLDSDIPVIVKLLN